MISLLSIQAPDLEKLFLGEQDYWFTLEILLRTLIMYLILLCGLRLTGKRGVRQLTVFELVVIIGLGSAAGDPMFYEEVGILSAIAVFTTVIGLYRFTTFLTAKSKVLEGVVEGKTVCVVEDGKFCINSFNKEDVAQDEFFSELRVRNVSHLGQVDRAYLEISGELSVFYFSDDNVKPGLPILPHQFENQLSQITEKKVYACTHCGNVETITPMVKYICGVCKNTKWVEAVSNKRIT